MLPGTSVRKGWPFARKRDPSKVMDKGKLPSTSPITSRVAFLVKLGAMVVIGESEFNETCTNVLRII